VKTYEYRVIPMNSLPADAGQYAQQIETVLNQCGAVGLRVAAITPNYPNCIVLEKEGTAPDPAPKK
jgi:hypothetical protein